MTLSKTWLKNNKHMLEYVQIEVYNNEFISREGRRVGGVCVYVKYCFKYKISKHIVNLKPDIEHIWIELTYRNKHSFVLVGVFYQDNFNNTSKTEWLGKCDPIMDQVLLKWDNTVILCGDTSIAIIKVNNPVYRFYRDILKEHGLTQHVTQSIRNNHAILDHITTDIPSRVKHTSVIQCPEISDHNCPYIITDAISKPFEPRYKIIRSMKDFDQQHYKETFASLPFTTIFDLKDLKDQLVILNDLIIKHLKEHEPMKRIQVTR